MVIWWGTIIKKRNICCCQIFRFFICTQLVLTGLCAIWQHTQEKTKTRIAKNLAGYGAYDLTQILFLKGQYWWHGAHFTAGHIQLSWIQRTVGANEQQSIVIICMVQCHFKRNQYSEIMTKCLSDLMLSMYSSFDIDLRKLSRFPSGYQVWSGSNPDFALGRTLASFRCEITSLRQCTIRINSLRRGNINIYLHFMSLLQIDMTQVLKILPRVRAGVTYSTYSISCLLMSLWRKKVTRSPNVKGSTSTSGFVVLCYGLKPGAPFTNMVKI